MGSEHRGSTIGCPSSHKCLVGEPDGPLAYYSWLTPHHMSILLESSVHYIEHHIMASNV